MSKTAIVTGASSGIGLETARQLHECGYTVYDLSRHDHGGEWIRHIPCDVTAEEQVKAAIAQAVEECGGIDILICCAGMGISGAVEFTDYAESRRLMDVNLFGTDCAVRAAVPLMRAAGRGRIVLTSSVAAVAPIPFQAWYSASKAAVYTYATALHNELRPFGITVCSVLPGDIKTGFTAARQKSAQGDEVYEGRITRSVSRMEHDEQNGLPASFAAKVIVKAALRRNPKPAVTTGFSYSVLMVLMKILPARLTRWVLYQMYAK